MIIGLNKKKIASFFGALDVRRYLNSLNINPVNGNPVVYMDWSIVSHTARLMGSISEHQIGKSS